MSKDKENEDDSSRTGRAVWLVTVITALPPHSAEEKG